MSDLFEIINIKDLLLKHFPPTFVTSNCGVISKVYYHNRSPWQGERDPVTDRAVYRRRDEAGILLVATEQYHAKKR